MKKHILPIILIIALSLIAYGNIFSNEFVWDDRIYLEENLAIRSLANTPYFFTEPTHGNLYRPLRSVLQAFVFSIWEFDVFGYHLSALLLHMIASVLIYLVALKLFHKRMLALCTGLLFAVHPIHTDRVTNMTAGFDLLGIVLMLAAFIAYLHYKESRDNIPLVISVVFFVLALLSSEEAFMLPFLIVLYELAFAKTTLMERARELAKNKALYVFPALLVIYVIIRSAVTGSLGRAAQYPAGTFSATMVTTIKILAHYLGLLILPINLSLQRVVPVATSLFDPLVFISLLLLLALIAAAAWSRARQPIIFFAIGWFFLTLIPFMNILPNFSLMEERYTYVASMGFCLLIAYAFTLAYQKKKWKIPTLVVFALLLILYTMGTLHRNAEWRDDITLWERTVTTSPNSARAWDNLGQSYEALGRFDDALEAIDTSLTIDENNAFAHNNLGIVFAEKGLYNYSIAEFLIAIELEPNYARAYDHLGLAYLRLNDTDKAIAAFATAIQLEPGLYKAYNDLGTALVYIGEMDRAELAFQQALKINSRYEPAQKNLESLQRLKAKTQ